MCKPKDTVNTDPGEDSPFHQLNGALNHAGYRMRRLLDFDKHEQDRSEPLCIAAAVPGWGHILTTCNGTGGFPSDEVARRLRGARIIV